MKHIQRQQFSFTKTLVLKGFKAWVKGVFWAYEWLAISLARRPRTEINFPRKYILRFSCALTFKYGHVTCHVTKHWNWRKLANCWRIYIITLFGQTNWHFWKRINIPNFLRLEWMYAKFKTKNLNNSRLNFGI